MLLFINRVQELPLLSFPLPGGPQLHQRAKHLFEEALVESSRVESIVDDGGVDLVLGGAHCAIRIPSTISKYK